MVKDICQSVCMYSVNNIYSNQVMCFFMYF